MLIPMCCFTCNMRVGALYPRYVHLTQQRGLQRKEAFEELGLTSTRHLCCRNMLMAQPDLYHTVQAQSCDNRDIPFVVTTVTSATTNTYDPQ